MSEVTDWGERLRAARLASSFTQQNLVDRLLDHGIRWAPQTVYKVEAGERKLTYDEGLALEAVLPGFGQDALPAAVIEGYAAFVQIKGIVSAAARLGTEPQG